MAGRFCEAPPPAATDIAATMGALPVLTFSCRSFTTASTSTWPSVVLSAFTASLRWVLATCAPTPSFELRPPKRPGADPGGLRSLTSCLWARGEPRKTRRAPLAWARTATAGRTVEVDTTACIVIFSAGVSVSSRPSEGGFGQAIGRSRGQALSPPTQHGPEWFTQTSQLDLEVILGL